MNEMDYLLCNVNICLRLLLLQHHHPCHGKTGRKLTNYQKMRYNSGTSKKNNNDNHNNCHNIIKYLRIQNLNSKFSICMADAKLILYKRSLYTHTATTMEKASKVDSHGVLNFVCAGKFSLVFFAISVFHFLISSML